MGWPWRRITPRKLEAKITSWNENSGFGIESEIEMSKLVDRMKTDLLLNMTIQTNVAYSVGTGYYISTEDNSPAATKNRKFIEKWCQEFNLDEKNQEIARDVWLSGNCFIDMYASDESPINGFEIVPLSSIRRIGRDDHGMPTHYHQQWGTGVQDIPANRLLHFRWRAIDNGAWGEGLAQIQARKGLGYKPQNGSEILHRPPQFEVNEMLSHVAAMLAYAGVPRYVLTDPDMKADDVSKVVAEISKLKPLQHLVANHNLEVKTASLQHGTMGNPNQERLDGDAITASISPILNLWKNMSFTFASSKEAIEAMMPLIDMYQRAHARFVEQNIFKPLIISEYSETAWEKAPVQLNWGKKEGVPLEEISAVFEILKDPMVSPHVEIEDIFKLLQEYGIDINIKKQQPAQQPSAPMQAITTALKKPLSQQEKNEIEKANILKLVKQRYAR